MSGSFFSKIYRIGRRLALRSSAAACLFIAPSGLYAQRLPFYNINVENGLLQSQPNSMVQDRDGHLWIGTLGGLSRYDGTSFTNYTVREGLPSNVIHALAVGDDGLLWIGSPAGLTSFDGLTIRHFLFRTSDNPGGNNVTSIQVADDGTVWCTAAGRPYSVKEGKSAALNFPEHILVTTLLASGSTLWLAGNDGKLYMQEGDDRQLIDPGVPGLFISSLWQDEKGTIWVLANLGLFRIREGRLEEYYVGSNSLRAYAPLSSMTLDSQGYYWLGTYSGVVRFRDTVLRHYTRKSGLSNNNFHDVLTDKEGNVWLASDGQGLFRFSGAVFSSYDEAMGLSSAQVMSVTADRSGTVYFGTYDAGLYEYRNGVLANRKFPGGIRPSVTALACRDGYELWIGTRSNGLYRYDWRGFERLSASAYGLPSGFVITLYQDSRKRIWIGYVNGAACYEQERFHVVPLEALSAKAFLEIGKDSMLIATTNGLRFYDGQAIHPFVTGTAADRAAPQCLTAKGSQIWIGTSDQGIIMYDLRTKEAARYDKRHGLKSDFIYNITADDRGNIWAGTGFGIHRISFRDSVPVIDFYGKEQGVYGLESNHNAVCRMPDGSIWFGTTNGALLYNPLARPTRSRPASVVMQSVSVFGEPVTDTSWYDSLEAGYRVPYGLKLPHRYNNITFHFHAVTLGSNEQIRYRYRISGLDDPWSSWSSVSSVTYSALPPGRYDFIVQCRAEHDADDEIKELHYTFEIAAPFHKTNLFRFLILVACILLGFLIQYIAGKRRQNRQKLVEKLRAEEQNKVRERTAEDFHDEVGNKLTRIQVLTNVLKARTENPDPDTMRIIGEIQESTQRLYSGTRDIIWSLKPANDNLYHILNRIKDVGAELFMDTDVEFEATGIEAEMRAFRLPLDKSRNIVMIFKEAMNNSLKYARAEKVSLSVSLKDRNVLSIKLKDDGTGFDIRYIRKGHGINNMQVRAERINGKLYIDSWPDRGTIITLSLRIPEEKDARRT